MPGVIKNKWLAAGIIVTLIISGIVYGFYQYNKPRDSAAAGKTDLSLEAGTILHDFETNESAATIKYLGKIIEVKGRVQAIDSVSGNFSVLLATGSSALINCAMTGPVPAVQLKEEIRIKGRCAGYMMDVMLVDCVIQ